MSSSYKSILNRKVQTCLGRGTVVAEFENGTICVRLGHGGGQIFARSEVCVIPEVDVYREEVDLHEQEVDRCLFLQGIGPTMSLGEHTHASY